MKQSSINLLNKYVAENSEVFTTDGKLLFCKVCNKSVSYDKKFQVEQHLRTQIHIYKYSEFYNIEQAALKDVLDKYVLENGGVFETDGEVLFCNACNTLVSFGKQTLVEQHLASQKHIENCNPQKEASLLSNKELLDTYVSANSDVYETDGNGLFCKICKISVACEKKFSAYQHLRNRRHLELCKEMIKTERSKAELLNKYVAENRKVFETDGKELYCKICHKSISFETRYTVNRHLKSQKHIYSLDDHQSHKTTRSKIQKFKSAAAKLLKKYKSEYNDVFEAGGEILFCKVCKKSVSFHKKYSVDQHLKTQKHKDNLAQSLGLGNAAATSEVTDSCEDKEGALQQTAAELLNKYVTENSDVFETDGEILFCKVCKKSVSFDKKFSVDQHLKTQKHKNKIAESKNEETASSFDLSREESAGESPTLRLQLNEDLCRTCMKQFSKMSQNEVKQKINEIPLKGDYNTSIMELLEIIQPQIKVEIKENLPTFMCSECVEKLLASYEFIEMYQNVDKKLRKMLTEFNADNCSDSDVEPKVLNAKETHEEEEEEEEEQDYEETKYELEIEEINIDSLKQQTDEEDNEWSEVENELSEDALNMESVMSAGSDDDWIPEKSWLNAAAEKQNSDASTSSPKRIIKSNENTPAHEEADQGNLQCLQCDSIFNSVKLMREHMRQNHAEKKAKRPYNRRSNEPRKKSTARASKNIPSKQGGNYHCEYCDKRYSNYVFYRTHMRLHTVEPHLCIECGKSFSRLSSFNTHMLRHKGEKNYQCPHCPKSFVCSSGLYGHMMVHTNNKPYVCDICGAAFHMAYQLRHHNLYHAGIKKFQCEYCDMRFVTREKQRRHMRTHTGEKPYRCKYCERAFAQSNDCVKHLRQHLGDNVYQCELCPLRFPLVRDLRVHFATHKDDDEATRERNLKARMEEERELQMRLCPKESA